MKKLTIALLGSMAFLCLRGVAAAQTAVTRIAYDQCQATGSYSVFCQIRMVVDGHDTSPTSEQEGEDRAFLRSGDRQRLPACLRDLERSEDEETHRRRLAPVTHPS